MMQCESCLKGCDVCEHQKLTFEEWFEQEHKDRNWLHNDLKVALARKLKSCWTAAQENK